MRIILNPTKIEYAATHLDLIRTSMREGYDHCVYRRGQLVVLVRRTKTGFSTREPDATQHERAEERDG